MWKLTDLKAQGRRESLLESLLGVAEYPDETPLRVRLSAECYSLLILLIIQCSPKLTCFRATILRLIQSARRSCAGGYGSQSRRDEPERCAQRADGVGVGALLSETLIRAMLNAISGALVEYNFGIYAAVIRTRQLRHSAYESPLKKGPARKRRYKPTNAHHRNHPNIGARTRARTSAVTSDDN